MPERPPPTDTVTFLFTDIEGSTGLWEAHPDTMRSALARHDTLLREILAASDAHIFKTVGDSFYVVFPTASSAVAAALACQIILQSEPWPEATPIRVRMGLHTGVAESRDGDYFGPSLNRVARLMAAGQGGQVLLSQSTYGLLTGALPTGASLKDLGRHRLKDLTAAETVWQLLHPKLPQAFRPLRSLDVQSTNLPLQLTTFIGREAEMAEIKERLRTARLLTLTGSGGTGKTRLLVQVGADVLDDYSDGVWLVELAPISDSNLVIQAVCKAMHVREAQGETLLETLLTWLKNKHILILFDNCEHVLESSAHLADAILRNCANVKLLSSSREALGVEGEVAYRVPSLSVPDSNREQTPDSLRNCQSARLFLERAALVQGNFELTEKNAPSLAAICRRLDGIPLAIELAAARLVAMPVEQIEKRLDARFSLLTGGARIAVPRHQTLRALIDWSYGLLNEKEQLLLGRLAVFNGGWRLEAAEGICSFGAIEDWEVLDLLTSLVRKSLVVYSVGDGDARYSLLESVRHFGLDRLLTSGEGEEVRDRHQKWFIALAVEVAPHLWEADSAEWFKQIDIDHENLRTALEWSLMRMEGTEFIQDFVALSDFWYASGLIAEGRDWWARALAKDGLAARTSHRARALNLVARLSRLMGDYDLAREKYAECLSIQLELGDTHGIASARLGMGLGAAAAGDYRAARGFFEESLALSREGGPSEELAVTLVSLSKVCAAQGDLDWALKTAHESLDLWRNLGNKAGVAYAQFALALVASSQGEYDSARELLILSVEALKKTGWQALGAATSIRGLASLALLERDYVGAQSYAEESLLVYREMGNHQGISDVQNLLGRIALGLEDYATARKHLAAGMTFRKGNSGREDLPELFESFAVLVTAEGKTEFGAMLWGVAERLREEMGTPIPANARAEHDREVSQTREGMGDELFLLAWTKGQQLPLGEAINLTL